MRLLSRLRSNYILAAALFGLLLFLPFNGAIEYLIITISDNFTSKANSVDNNLKKLEIENIAIKLKLKEYEEIRKENEKLKLVLKLQEDKQALLIGAETIAFDPSSWRRVVIINRGRRHGIKEGMYAIDNRGFLMGKIIETTDSYAKLSLVSDPDFFIPVFVGDESLGLLEGGLDRIKILYVENSENIKNNDVVWCKPLGVSFPIQIGKIKNVVKSGGGMFQQIEVELFAQHPVLRTVYILK